MNDTTFRNAIHNAGLGHPDVIADGTLHRFRSTQDKPGCQSGWYVCFGDAGAFGDWKTGLKETWNRSRSKPPSKAEWNKINRAITRQRQQRSLETQERHQDAAAHVQELWTQGAIPMWHPYLKAKRVLPLGIRQRNKVLLVPLSDTESNLWNLQIIYPDGAKRFLKGARKKGLFCQIGEVSDHLYICEGYATGATLHMYYDKNAAVFVAFDAGNLKPVAESLLLKYPDCKIIIAADNDCWGRRNIGLEKGRAAAAAVGGELIYPVFEDVDTSARPSDFNDLYCLGGL